MEAFNLDNLLGDFLPAKFPVQTSQVTGEVLAPEGTDPRILNLSYSSLLTLHSCPRRYELEKLQATSDTSESQSQSITFSYGQIVGLGIQLTLEHKSDEEILWQMYLGWKPELFADNPKQNKSFAAAVFAVQKFQAMLSQGYLEDYELVYYNGKPACELSFLITLPSGFKYRGFVDAVLQHRISGEVVVLECKTSSAVSLNAATYKNSAQAIGYSIVLDAMFPALSSYEVIYLIYSTKQLQYEQLKFSKSYVQRARWIRELLLDVDTISSYVGADLFPMRGESCFSFYSECKYKKLCQMETSKLTSTLTQDEYEKIQVANDAYQIQISISDLIAAQLEKE